MYVCIHSFVCVLRAILAGILIECMFAIFMYWRLGRQTVLKAPAYWKGLINMCSLGRLHAGLLCYLASSLVCSMTKTLLIFLAR